jgi:hypothetical protein
MGIRFTCPNGHKLHVKAFLAGKRGVCPQCGSKILIPTAEDGHRSINESSAELGEPRRTDAGQFKGEPIAALGSPSIIIALADMPAAIQPLAEAARPRETGPEYSTLPPPVPIQTIMNPQAVPQPANSYRAYRERAHRNQLNIAIALLVTVIVLALILIFVLQRSSGPSSARHVPPTRLEETWPSSYVARTIGEPILKSAPVIG